MHFPFKTHFHFNFHINSSMITANLFTHSSSLNFLFFKIHKLKFRRSFSYDFILNYLFYPSINFCFSHFLPFLKSMVFSYLLQPIFNFSFNSNITADSALAEPFEFQHWQFWLISYLSIMFYFDASPCILIVSYNIFNLFKILNFIFTSYFI